MEQYLLGWFIGILVGCALAMAAMAGFGKYRDKTIKATIRWAGSTLGELKYTDNSPQAFLVQLVRERLSALVD